MKIKRGSVVVIKEGWDKTGLVGVALGSPVFVGQWWVPVLFRGDEDPEFFKMTGLEILVVKLPAAPEGTKLLEKK